MNTSDLNYDLPEELIAQRPAPRRTESRLMVLDRAERSIGETTFADIGAYLNPGDCLVLNDTRVIRARLHGRKKTGGQVEIFLLKELGPAEWEAMVRPGARIKPGTDIYIGESVVATVGVETTMGRRRVTMSEPDVVGFLERTGEIPLPPYIHRDEEEPGDVERYQTVFAKEPGAVAAPTAGLHFTDALFDELRGRGIETEFLTLHVGYGTFKPIHVERLDEHQVDAEWYSLPDATADKLNAVRAAGGRVIPVGTTSTRTIESCWSDGGFRANEGWTNAYFYPPYEFRGVDALITNFHLPQSSLLALVSAFAGHDFVMEAYREAVERKFRFYSYGDAMLIL